MPDLYGFSMKAIDGTDQRLGDYKGKVLLIVNVASQCGLTPQYEGLQKLHAEYAPQGFAVLGFPCNQDPGRQGWRRPADVREGERAWHRPTA
jgi:glutathione peroxidase